MSGQSCPGCGQPVTVRTTAVGGVQLAHDGLCPPPPPERVATEGWLLPLSYITPPLSLNQRDHHMAVHKVRTQLMNEVLTLARALNLPRGLDHVDVALLWRVTDQRRRDSDNPVLTLKACVDALARYGLVPDDTYRYVSHRVLIQPDVAAGLALFITRRVPLIPQE